MPDKGCIKTACDHEKSREKDFLNPKSAIEKQNAFHCGSVKDFNVFGISPKTRKS